MLNKHIVSASSLVTSKEETRAGFISYALEKNRLSTPIIEKAKVLKTIALEAKTPIDLLKIKTIERPLLSAAGLSDKSLKYFNESDKAAAVKNLIENFLEPAGEYFVDELVYRYLLLRGDSLGGSMRNLVGIIAEKRLVDKLIAYLRVENINYKYLIRQSKTTYIWLEQPSDGIIESPVKAISWEGKNGPRTLAFNLTIPLVKKNIDICLFDCDEIQYQFGKIVHLPDKILMLGELKGGIDPAGADEHWKTANSALNRIRVAFQKENKSVMTSFVGAAIENAMAKEIYMQLKSDDLTNAANLSDESQLIEYCKWVLEI